VQSTVARDARGETGGRITRTGLAPPAPGSPEEDRIMKSKWLMGATMLVASLGALADPPTQVPDIEIFMAGATAQKNTIANLLGGYAGGKPTTWTSTYTFPAVTPLCAAGTLDIFYDPAQSTPIVLSAGSQYRAYSCTLAATSNVPTELQGKHIRINYRLLGGSWQGVGPLARAQSIGFMPVGTNCTASSTPTTGAFPLSAIFNKPTYTCTIATLNNAVPDVGVSDQEPAMFVGANAPYDGNPGTDPQATPITAGGLGNISATPLQAVVMAVVGSRPLVCAMQTNQGLAQSTSCANLATAATSSIPFGSSPNQRPTISSSQITAILTSAFLSPYAVDWSPVVPTTGVGQFVHVCRRISAVGTQIAANAFWLNYPCASTAVPPATGPVYPFSPSTNGSIQVITTLPTGGSSIVETNLIADLRACVAGYATSASATDQWALGLLFGDNAPSTESFNWDWLSIDGIEPSIANAVTGKYRWVTTETWNIRTAKVNGVSPASGLKQELVNLLFQPTAITTTALPRGGLGNPALLSMQIGFLAVNDQPNGWIPGTGAGQDGDNVWYASTGGPNACNNPILFK
jgi:hypothetical protein